MKTIFQVRDICFHYPGTNHNVLNHVSFSLQKGTVLSILGPNGAGKSTLLNCLAGLCSPQTGSILLEGKPLLSITRQETAQKIAYVRQLQSSPFRYNVFQFVLMGRAPYISLLSHPKKQDEEIAWQAMEQLGIIHLANHCYTEISGGERQQCVIARALAQQPDVILFDEPTAFLDFGNQGMVLKLMKKMAADGYGIVMTTHNPDHALLLDDQVAVLDNNGTITYGKSTRLLTEDSLRRLYNADLRIVYMNELGRCAAIHNSISL